MKLYARYAKHEILHESHFEPMYTTNEDASITTVDHSKLDMWKADETTHRRRHSSASSRTGARAPSLTPHYAAAAQMIRGSTFAT